MNLVFSKRSPKSPFPYFYVTITEAFAIVRVCDAFLIYIYIVFCYVFRDILCYNIILQNISVSERKTEQKEWAKIAI